MKWAKAIISTPTARIIWASNSPRGGARNKNLVFIPDKNLVFIGNKNLVFIGTQNEASPKG